MKKFHFQAWLCIILLLAEGCLSDSSTKEDGEEVRERFSHFDTDGFLDFDDERPSVVVKTSRVTSSSSAVSTSLRRSLVGRGLSGGVSSTTQRPTTPMATILKQINEHNEDGSYTYGYEASDGSFKLETRYPDGRVQGKYGYVDINGEQKVIEYGADMLGFQPQGDLPEGIIVPPPVFNEEDNPDRSEAQAGEPLTDYDYDYSGSSEDGRRSRFVVKNRARASARAPASTPTRGKEPSLRESLESQPKITFADRFQTDFEARKPFVPHPPTPTAAPVQLSRSTPVPFAPTPRHEAFIHRLTTTEAPTSTTTPITTTPQTTTTVAPSIVEIPQVPRKIRIHHASRLTTTPPPHNRSPAPRQQPSRSRRPLPSSGSPDPLEALKAFMLSNGPFTNFGSSRAHTHRRLRPPHRSGESRSLPPTSNAREPSSSRGSLSPPSRSSSSDDSSPAAPSRGESPSSRGSEGRASPRFSSFPARPDNQGRNSLDEDFPSVSSTTTAAPEPEESPSTSTASLKLPPAFQEQRRPIRILTSAVPGASINRIPSVTDKPKPGEIVPTDVDFDALIQEFTGQRRRQESSPFLGSSSGSAFPHFSQRTSGPSSLELFADFS